MKESRVVTRKQGIIKHIIFLLVAIAVTVPYVLNLSLPGRPNHWAEKVYSEVENLKPGSHVLLAFDFDPSAKAELDPMARAIVRHCFKKGLVPIMMTHWPNGLNLMSQITKECADESKELWGQEKLAGRDYVVLGYRPGVAMLVLNMGESIKGAFEKDAEGNSTQSMAALANVNSLKDIDLAVDLAAGATPQMWIAYGSDRFHFPLAVGSTAVQAPDMYPFVQSGQVVGFLGGLRGAADYETLLNKPGEATKAMPSQSAVHVLLVLLILGANVRLLVERIGKRKGQLNA